MNLINGQRKSGLLPKNIFHGRNMKRKPYFLRPERREDTARLHVKKYYDSDSNKFITDKLETIYSLSWADVQVPETQLRHEDNYKKFTPRDNDWED